ncbi:UDP-N-acetylmuramoyl-L-alanyl-D-glutamate--2, 6-diaminopimelate ligase [Desulfovibrionales bacterium]
MSDAEAFAKLVELTRRGLMVHTHSQHVRPGEILVVLPTACPTSTLGAAEVNRYISEALEHGAKFVVVQKDIVLTNKYLNGRIIRISDPRAALGDLASAHFGTGRLPFPVIGITGTNGKTTICYLLEHLFRENGYRVGILGTVSYRWPKVEFNAPLTTPDCWQLHELFKRMAEAQVDIAFMEVSSHAIDQQRVAGLNFAAAVFTNLTQDHLDYHTDMEHYFRTKVRLFHNLPEKQKTCVINWNDTYGLRLLETCHNTIGYGLYGPNPLANRSVPELKGHIVANTIEGLSILMGWKDQAWKIKSPLIGRYNASNLLATQAVGLAFGLTHRELIALNTCVGAPGRMERIQGTRGQIIFVDYAHSPDALKNVLVTLKDLQPARIITVFGCGGNRDRSKRPLMGQAVARWSDMIVLTSDNPRHEDPLVIIADVLPGLEGCLQVVVEPDRRAAITLALKSMKEGDILLIAGKGHETYQQIEDQKVVFSDQTVVQELLS